MYILYINDIYIFRRSVAVTFLTLNITLYSNTFYICVSYNFTIPRSELFSHTYSQIRGSNLTSVVQTVCFIFVLLFVKYISFNRISVPSARQKFKPTRYN